MNTRKTAHAAFLLAVGVALVAAVDARLLSILGSSSSEARSVEDELLIRFKPGFASDVKARALTRLGVTTRARVAEARESKGELLLVKMPPGVSSLLRRLAQQEDSIEYAEPNWVYQTQQEEVMSQANEAFFTNGSLWGMYGSTSSPSNAFGSHAALAWANDQTSCSSVYVGIVDEGIMTSHSDLSGNTAGPPGEFPADGIDNDWNGYADDVKGWDFCNDDNTVFDGADDDHGTHVAGIIGGSGGNNAGVAGVCWTAKIISAKFIGPGGGTTANAVRAIDYLVDLKKYYGTNIAVINNSWGGGGYSQALYDAISRANASNILFVAAAGNGANNTDTNPFYPASYDLPNIISVASINSAGSMAANSNYGTTTVDLGAPGVGIWSTIPQLNGTRIISGYGSFSGTSMAAAHVTGAVALYAHTYPQATAAQIKSVLLSTTTATTSLSGKVNSGGRLNIQAMLATPP